jgi:exosortase/archaeosortase family protein
VPRDSRPRGLLQALRNAGRHRLVRPPYPLRSRSIAIALLALIALSLMVFQYQFRHLEADAAGHIYGVLTPTLVASSAPIIWFGLGSVGAFGLIITPDCSSALLIAPLCGLGIALMIPRRLPVRRVAKALTVAAAVMVTGNLLRIGVIALAIRLGGMGAGYQVGHLVLGSMVSVVCIALGLILLTVIVTSRGGQLTAAVLRSHRRAAQ